MHIKHTYHRKSFFSSIFRVLRSFLHVTAYRCLRHHHHHHDHRGSITDVAFSTSKRDDERFWTSVLAVSQTKIEGLEVLLHFSGGVAQWLGRRSVAGGLSLFFA